MTAGLKPRRLVRFHQHGHLVLEFSVKKEIHPGLSEPLMSRTLWQKGLQELRKVMFGKRIWSVSQLVKVETRHDDQGEILIAVVLKVENDEACDALLISLFGQITAFRSPAVEYIFADDEQAKERPAEKNSKRTIPRVLVR